MYVAFIYYRVFYDRGWGILGTNIASAIWHGFYPGYYLSFIMVALGSIIGRKVLTVNVTCTCPSLSSPSLSLPLLCLSLSFPSFLVSQYFSASTKHSLIL